MSIPARLNLCLLIAAMAGAAGALYLASHLDNLWLVFGAAVAFSFVNNTIFSLLHEAVHGIFHPNRRVNLWAGRFAAAFFPTSFSIQRAFHLTHHRYNRTPEEQFDLIRPGDNRLLKVMQWYSILTGVYGLSPTFFCVVYAVAPGLFQPRRENRLARQTSATIYFASVEKVPLGVVRGEVLLWLTVQVGLYWLLGLDPLRWALCHFCFAFNWSALQYADHAFSPLDPKEGAWNLKVNRVVRWLFLNYHFHLAHHEFPQASWIHLPRLVRPDCPQPAFWHVYLRMWAGPRRINSIIVPRPAE